jgi:hypothetical protein
LDESFEFNEVLVLNTLVFKLAFSCSMSSDDPQISSNFLNSAFNSSSVWSFLFVSVNSKDGVRILYLSILGDSTWRSYSLEDSTWSSTWTFSRSKRLILTRRSGSSSSRSWVFSGTQLSISRSTPKSSSSADPFFFVLYY